MHQKTIYFTIKHDNELVNDLFKSIKFIYLFSTEHIKSDLHPIPRK